MVKELLKQWYGITPEFFVDKNPKGAFVRDCLVISPEEFEKMQDRQWFVGISIEAYKNNDKTRREIDKMFDECGGVVITKSCDSLCSVVNIEGWANIKKYAEKFDRVRKKLQDDISRQTFDEYLRAAITGGRYMGETYPEEFKYWGIDTPDDCMFEITDSDVWLHFGASAGDTIATFLRVNKSYKKILAIEGDDNRYKVLEKNVGLFKEEDRKKIQLYKVFIDNENNKADDIFAEEKITLINMDIEGYEISALNSCMKIIKKNRPILAICAYHKWDDLLTISEWIEKNVNDYVMLLRKYPTITGGYKDHFCQTGELVMYGIPIERYKKY